jgi:hypothetical protein
MNKYAIEFQTSSIRALQSGPKLDQDFFQCLHQERFDQYSIGATTLKWAMSSGKALPVTPTMSESQPNARISFEAVVHPWHFVIH